MLRQGFSTGVISLRRKMNLGHYSAAVIILLYTGVKKNIVQFTLHMTKMNTEIEGSRYSTGVIFLHIDLLNFIKMTLFLQA